MSMIARQRTSASEPAGGKGRHTPRRWLRACAAIPALLLLTAGSASADIFSDAWDAAKRS